jgi:hypothetical protein
VEEKGDCYILTFAFSTIASAPFQIAKAIEGVMDAELNDRKSIL